MAGDIHLSLCQTIDVAMLIFGPCQFSVVNCLFLSSVAITISGKKPNPMPALTHCLMASMLENSVTFCGLTFADASCISSILRYPQPASVSSRVWSASHK